MIIDIKMSDHISIQGNKDTLSSLKRMRIYISKKVLTPNMAKNLMRVNTVLQGLGDITPMWEGISVLKCVGLAFTIAASLIHKKQRKVNI